MLLTEQLLTEQPSTAMPTNQWFFVRPAINSFLGVMIGILIGNFLGWC